MKNVSFNSKPHYSKKGFTLIELLVVIAIIALLISILLPSLESARRQAKLNACLSHIKGIASSSRVYEADDVTGWGIPVHPTIGIKDESNPKSWKSLSQKGRFVGAYEWGGKSGIGWPNFDGGSSALDSAYGTRKGFGPATRPLNAVFYKGGFPDFGEPYNRAGATRDTELQLEVYKCPGDDGPPRGAHCKDWLDNTERSSYDHFGNSYAANIFMTSTSGGGGPIRSNSPYLRPTTRVPTPARTLYYEENIGRWAWSCKAELSPDCDFVGPGVDPGPTKTLRGWHGRDWTYNRAFVDAHAETQRIYIEGTENSEGYANHYRNEQLGSYPRWPGCGDGPDVPGSYDQYRCIIVRGDGWQKDTMPADLICTGLTWSGAGRPSYETCVFPASN